MHIPDDVLIASRNLIIHYLQRRRETVVEIMLESRPQLFEWIEKQGIQHGINLEPYFRIFNGLPEEERWMQSGIWRGEWKHWFHGIGCRLTHIETGEPFDWDVTNPSWFHEREFVNHLDWRMQYETDDLSVKCFVQWHNDEGYSALESVFIHLQEEKILRKILREHLEHQWQLVK